MHGLGSERKEMPEVFTEEFLEWFEEEHGVDRSLLSVMYTPDSVFGVGSYFTIIPLTWVGKEDILSTDEIMENSHWTLNFG